jgi:hypothetical protein
MGSNKELFGIKWDQTRSYLVDIEERVHNLRSIEQVISVCMHVVTCLWIDK